MYPCIAAVIFWLVFLLCIKFQPQKMRNAYLLFAAAGCTILAVAAAFGRYCLEALAAEFVLIVIVMLAVPVVLICNGVRVLKKEGKSATHYLSLALGFLIAGGELSSLHIIARVCDNAVFSAADYILCFFSLSAFYVSLVILAFVIYSIGIQYMPHGYNFDFVIIHGCGLIKGKWVSKLLSDRLDRAVEIYDRSRVKPMLVPSGGKGSDEQISEAQAMKDYLVFQGIPEENIILEDRSTSTIENLRYSGDLIGKLKPKAKIALVSSNYHIYRCLSYASDLGMKCTGIGARVAPYYWPSALLREFAAVYSKPVKILKFLLGYVFFVLLPMSVMIFL